MSEPKWPSRRPCTDCGTRKGKLRRACPLCALPVCEDCYPQRHTVTPAHVQARVLIQNEAAADEAEILEGAIRSLWSFTL